MGYYGDHDYVYTIKTFVVYILKMSTQNKMNSDYLWVRNAPIEQGLKFKNHGQYYLYSRAPNSIQRLEMVYRSIGKTFDWLGRKIVDKGNKKRLYRNFARFLKHPVGYLFWRTARWQQASAPRFVMGGFLLSWIWASFEWGSYLRTIQEHDAFLLSAGKNIEGMSGRYTGYHNSNMVRSPTLFDTAFRVPISPDMIIINQTWKQNIRKQLQLTNTHNVAF